MSIKIECPKCAKRYSVNDRLAGRQTQCPKCDSLMQVPSLEQIAALRRRKQRAAEAAALADRGAAAAGRQPQGVSWAIAVPAAPRPAPPAAEDRGFEPLPIGGRGNRHETVLDMTPMVDVTFLLLIFFMVTASFALQKSIAMPRQQSEAPSTQPVEQEQDELDQVTVQIDEYGAFLVLAPDWERDVAGKPSLVTALREAKQSSGGGGVRLVIECHEAAKLQSLVDAMDAGTICDYEELQITQVDGF